MERSEFEAIKARLRASAERDRSPAGRYARQLATEAMAGHAGALPPAPHMDRPPTPPTEREQLLADGFTYTVRDTEAAEADAEHRARRREADAAVQGSERLYRSLRDTLGADYADAWMRGDSA